MPSCIPSYKILYNRAVAMTGAQDPDGALDLPELTKYLKNYAAIGEKYVVILQDIIEKNSLTDFDKANLLPTKLKTGIAL